MAPSASPAPAAAIFSYDARMSDAVIHDAWTFLRSHTRGDLRFDEHLRPLKYVIAPDGQIAAPVMVAMLQSVDTVLFVPEFAEGAMELQVTLQPFEERGPLAAVADRWRIYHGEPDDVRWAFLKIDAARFKGMVIDGEALMRPNPLAADEARLCRTMNTDHLDDLRTLCASFGNMRIERPLMVGIDPLGIDVRAMFEVVRVPSTGPMNSADQAQQILARMSHTASEKHPTPEPH
ncbi:MAG: DUF2470 domain-containing protein [Phycisphaerales bacterium]|nr:DUF2470 domain-containing protein [Phycisphaerales bacterium]MCI0629812.1 DUF2470 domain-containing protein [Phycisphaerales bacterium]MCI0674693.1 DUF2470 domain-containing protein [Phycisphaerales bacterium]